MYPRIGPEPLRRVRRIPVVTVDRNEDAKRSMSLTKDRFKRFAKEFARMPRRYADANERVVAHRRSAPKQAPGATLGEMRSHRKLARINRVVASM